MVICRALVKKKYIYGKNVHQNKQQLNNGGSVILVFPGIIGQDLAKKTQLLQLSLTTFLTD